MNDGEAERAYLVGIRFPNEERHRATDSLKELERLAQSAGARIVGVLLCELRIINSATLIGKGRVGNIVEAIDEFPPDERPDLVIFDSDLSPVQQRNIEDVVQIRVLDRAALILDIFAQRARSAEGKIQVELAQLRYLQTRLIGKGVLMSKLGGGIGTRGPGETKLEMDRRRIRRRVSKLRGDLETVRKTRKLHRSRREGVPIPTVALVGYTNSGKSTLLNTLTDAEVVAEDKLFATLDPTTRKLKLPNGQRALLTDTVGFIRRLPHALVEAFRATFEEALAADLLLNVVDYSHPQWREQADVVDKALREMNVGEKPVLRVYNKVDAVAEAEDKIGESDEDGGVYISALKDAGLDRLLWAIAGKLKSKMRRVTLNLPVNAGDVINEIYRRGYVIEREDDGDTVRIEANIETPLAEKLKKRGFVA